MPHSGLGECGELPRYLDADTSNRLLRTVFGANLVAMEIDCERCNRKFTIKPYRLGKAKFCSVECRRSGKTYQCEGCGVDVYRAPSHAPGKRVFCSVECASGTQFRVGGKPWNDGVKGIHLSPESEFKPGPRPNKRSPIGSVSIRTRSRDGKQRAWVKVAQPNRWTMRAQAVWVSENGPIPNGFVIHHRDRDALNDDIGNLQMMTRAEHIDEHREELKSLCS